MEAGKDTFIAMVLKLWTPTRLLSFAGLNRASRVPLVGKALKGSLLRSIKSFVSKRKVKVIK